ncbi:MAG: T9SS type A sorting domain-containing protein [Dysgonamonadaceae bacterium]|jgi:hypothetical protein|nr:T9SS type A sorting domain-containing protein [Dysgonamonadaceae bacterium]
MKKNYFLLLVLCFFAMTSFSAQPEGKTTRLSKERIFKLKMHGNQSSMLRTAIALNVLIFEDFSKFTEGSEAAPTTVDLTDDDLSIPASYTQVEGWWGWGVFQAGGVAYIGWVNYSEYDPEIEDGPGFIATPSFDVSFSPDNYTIKFKARSKSATGGELDVYWNWNDGYNYNGETVFITDQWAEYTVTALVGDKRSFVDIWGYGSEFFIDDIEISAEGDTGITDHSVNNNVNFYVSENALSANGLATSAVVEIYNLIGVKVQTAVYDSGNIKLNLAKGAYIVRSGNYSQKIIF